MHTKWLAIEPWKKWCQTVFNSITESGLTSEFDSDDELGESPAVEVLKYREKNGYFGQSPEKRDPKPPHVSYRVGQVIKHKKWDYQGVIIGWDLTAKAPPEWIEQMHGDNVHWKDQPNYAILIDTRDRPAPQLSYVPQENIKIIKNKKILHPAIDQYFEQFDGAQYLPRPWLRALYPRD